MRVSGYDDSDVELCSAIFYELISERVRSRMDNHMILS